MWRGLGALTLLALAWPSGSGAADHAPPAAPPPVVAAAQATASMWNLPRKRLDRAGAQQVAADMEPMVFVYTVRQGDTLTAIAQRFATSVASLEKINHLSGLSVLQLGQRVTVLRRVGWLYTVRNGDTASAIAQRAGVGVATLEAANGLMGSNPVLLPGERLIIPRAPTAAAQTPVAGPAPVGSPQAAAPTTAAQVAAPAAQGLIWPVHGPITSPFGWRLNPWGGDGWFFHHGIDIGVPMNTPVAAACTGRVVLASWDGGYGRAVEIQCSSGPLTLYAHNQTLEVAVGQWVQQGGLISYSGMTGNATGPHVHFGVMVAGQWRNPMDYLPPQ